MGSYLIRHCTIERTSLLYDSVSLARLLQFCEPYWWRIKWMNNFASSHSRVLFLFPFFLNSSYPWFFIAFYDIHLTATHIPGLANLTADVCPDVICTHFYSEPTDLHGSHPTTSITTTNHNTSRHRLNIPSLSLTVHQYYQKGLATSTHKYYQAAIQQYLTLCDQFKHTPVPTNESTLPLYILLTWGKKAFLSNSTINVYL